MVAGCGRVMDYYLSVQYPFLVYYHPGWKKGTPIPFWKVYKLTVSGFALNYATPVGLMGGEPYRIMELTPYVGASKATSSVILYVMMHIFSHFCFWFFSIFLYLALRPVDIAMGTILAVVGAVSLLAIYFL